MSLQSKIDVNKLLLRFGGVSELWHKLAAQDQKVSIKTIEKWRERESIPSARLVQLISLSKIEGAKIDLDDYIISQ
jgi:hypothetical protein